MFNPHWPLGLSANTPVLPVPWVQALWIDVAWSLLVFAALQHLLAVPVIARWWHMLHKTVRAGFYLLIALWLWWPSHQSLSAQLSLVFQSPSLVLVAWAMCQGIGWPKVNPNSAAAVHLPFAFKLFLVVLGWLLLVDSLNLWPRFLNFYLYPLGFGWPALAATTLGVAASMLRASFVWGNRVRAAWLFIALVAVFALLRLPTGNVWDALLDPIVWLVLNVRMLTALRAWWLKRAKPTQAKATRE